MTPRQPVQAAPTLHHRGAWRPCTLCWRRGCGRWTWSWSASCRLAAARRTSPVRPLTETVRLILQARG